jgi:hypothetical protein
MNHSITPFSIDHRHRASHDQSRAPPSASPPDRSVARANHLKTHWSSTLPDTSRASWSASRAVTSSQSSMMITRAWRRRHRDRVDARVALKRVDEVDSTAAAVSVSTGKARTTSD